MEHLGHGWVLPPWFHVLVYESFSMPSKLPNRWLNFIEVLIPCDTLAHSLKESNVNLKMETMEGVEVRSLVCNTLGVEGHVGAPGCGLRKVTSGSIIHTDLHKPNNKWLMHSWSIFRARTSHMHTQTHKTHHDLDLGKATTFPLIPIFMISHGGCIQLSFFP
jgi:hypothetical protein